MKIIIADKAGFCFGVRRAVSIAEESVAKRKEIYTFGPLIHNPQEIVRLESIGVKTLDKPNSKKGSVLVIRTHGIPDGLAEKIKAKGVKLVDATCPFVKRAQEIVKDLSDKGYQVIIAGDREHPEVKALTSYGGKFCRVVENAAEVKKIKLKDKIGVISQTTQDPYNFKEIVECIKKHSPSAKTHNTICRATIDRQESARKLAKKVDLLIVVGGKNSGNTRRLYEIASEIVKTKWIETQNEIKPQWFVGVKTVGITAGASTPHWIIEEVKNKIVSEQERRKRRQK